jgi:hypothetical protein
MLTKDGDFYAGINIAQGFPPKGSAREEGAARRDANKQAMIALLRSLAAVPGLAAALHGIRGLPPPRYDETAWGFIEACSRCSRAAARLQLVFAEARAIDFIEASQIALRALGEPDAPSDLLLRLDMRIEHLLVDEFQDTSLSQYELIERLVAGWTPGDGRTLFVVGDPMQSVYGFREAEVGLYLDAQRQRRLGEIALEPLVLQCNFRSQCDLVGWVNRVFAQAIDESPRPTERVVAFGAATPVLPAESPPAVTVEACTTDADEAAKVVSHVRTALTDRAEVAILVRKRGDLAEILPALRGAGIPFAAVDLDRMADRQTILDLASLTHALIQPDDRLAWLAVLRAPWCGLTLPDVFALDGAAGGRSLCEAIVAHQAPAQVVPASMSADGAHRLQRLAATIAPPSRIAAACRSLRPSEGLARPRRTGLHRGAERSGGCRAIFTLLAEHAPAPMCPTGTPFSMRWLPHSSRQGRRRREGADHDLASCERAGIRCRGHARSEKPPGSGARNYCAGRRAGGLLLAPIAARHVDLDERDPVYGYLNELAASEEAAELVRLLYVGCTRARKRLHLTTVLGAEAGENAQLRWRKPSRGTALSALWAAIEADLPPPTPSVAAITTSSSASDGVPLLRLPLDWRPPPLPPALPIASRAAAADEQVVEFDWVAKPRARSASSPTGCCANVRTRARAMAVGAHRRPARAWSRACRSGIYRRRSGGRRRPGARRGRFDAGRRAGRWLFDPRQPMRTVNTR